MHELRLPGRDRNTLAGIQVCARRIGRTVDRKVRVVTKFFHGYVHNNFHSLQSIHEKLRFVNKKAKTSRNFTQITLTIRQTTGADAVKTASALKLRHRIAARHGIAQQYLIVHFGRGFAAGRVLKRTKPTRGGSPACRRLPTTRCTSALREVPRQNANPTKYHARNAFQNQRMLYSISV